MNLALQIYLTMIMMKYFYVMFPWAKLLLVLNSFSKQVKIKGKISMH